MEEEMEEEEEEEEKKDEKTKKQWRYSGGQRNGGRYIYIYIMEKNVNC